MGSGCWRVSSNWGTHTWDMLEERRGELAEQEGEDKGGGEEAAVGEARGAAGHGRCRRRAEVAGAARADGRQARCAPHPAAAILSLPRAEPGSSCSSSALDPLSLRDSRVGVLRSSSLSVRQFFCLVDRLFHQPAAGLQQHRLLIPPSLKMFILFNCLLSGPTS
jgi:hypothetical protein